MSNTTQRHSEPPTSPKETTPLKPFKLGSHNLKPISYFKLYRYATRMDKCLMVLGTIAAIANGAAIPCSTLLFGQMTNALAEGGQAMIDRAAQLALYFVYIGIGTFVCSYLGYFCWMSSGERQAIRFRSAYFKALLRQEIGWYDALNPNELATRVADECTLIQTGIGEKFALCAQTITTVLTGFLIGFVNGWQLSLVLCGCIPLLSIAGTMIVTAQQKSSRRTTEAYAEAGARAEQALGAIRTVQSLCGEEHEISVYREGLEKTRKIVMKFAGLTGTAMGLIMFSINIMFCVGFYMGSYLIGDHWWNAVTNAPYSVGDVLTIFFAIMMGAMAISAISPCFEAFAEAQINGAKAFAIIDRESHLSPHDPSGAKLDKIIGEVKFEDVEFSYPINPGKQILKKINFIIERGQKTALVGESGCGKSTCMQLIERFYDTDAGHVRLDGHSLKDLNIKWLRENIGYVGQEPVLFATSIRENMQFVKEDATDSQIYEALKKANAYDFVMTLPDKLETQIGNALLSGGQKQRLAIARAILKNPPVLLLDEATSALDRKNEREIQKTLDEISEGRTTIVIAHRLSTIINVDKIVVFDQGVIVEQGKHEELIAKKGRYHALQAMQIAAQEEDQKKQKQREVKEKEEKGKVADNDELFWDTPEERPENDLIRLQKAKARQNKVSPAEKIEVPQVQRQQSIQKRLPSIRETLEPFEIITSNDVPTQPSSTKPKHRKESNLFRVLSFSKPERLYHIIGFLTALTTGSIRPISAILLSHYLTTLANPSSPTFRHDADFLSLMYLTLALIAFVSQTIEILCFVYVGECLTVRIRTLVFTKYLKMNIGWFDRPENSPGNLTTKLASDAAQLRMLTTRISGMIVQAGSSMVTGVVIALTASWQLALIGCVTAPLLFLSGVMQGRVNRGFAADTEQAYNESGGFLSECVVNLRTVASFARESRMERMFWEKMQYPLNQANKKAVVSGAIYGFSQLVMNCSNALTFYVGAVFIRDIGLTFQEFFLAMFGVMFACMAAGQVIQFMPDIGTTQNACDYVFDLLDTKPEIDIDNPEQNVTTPIVGNIEFVNCSFKYPTREKMVFRNLSFKISKSQKVAFVGSSGCGKSTCIQLLTRFYDPIEGQILIDGVDIKKYDMRHLRKSIGLVSQEPVLFNGSIEYNLKYTKQDASMAEVRAAAAEANALGFIENNEFDSIQMESKDMGTGFQRQVGPKGSQISGGQKQRIAIARAILKKPTILLLDEATSALDTQNEEIVQKSLDKIMQGKTSLSIAHRLSTIRDCDEIMVFQEGKIVEKGRYEELVARKGVFYNMEKGTN